MAAVAVPEELIDAIIEKLAPRLAFVKPSVKSTKKELSSCSLISRYWVDRCRTRIFEEITLRSLQDLSEFVAFLDEPSSNVREYTRDFVLEPRDVSPPWIHLAYTLLKPKLIRPGELTVILESTRSREVKPGVTSTVRPFHSVHSLLPRTLPSLFFRYHQLTLHNHHFRSFIDFMRLVGALPVLHHLTAKQLSWTNLPEKLECIRFTHQLRDIDVVDCQDHWPMLPLLASSSRLQTRQAIARPCQLHSDQLDQLRRILSLLFSQSSGTVQHGVASTVGFSERFRSGHLASSTEESIIAFTHNTPSLVQSVHVGFGNAWAYCLLPFNRAHAPILAHVAHLEIELTLRPPISVSIDQVYMIDWVRIAQSLSEMSSFKEFTVLLSLEREGQDISQEELTAFHANFIHIMSPFLSRENMVMCQWDGKGWQTLDFPDQPTGEEIPMRTEAGGAQTQ